MTASRVRGLIPLALVTALIAPAALQAARPKPAPPAAPAPWFQPETFKALEWREVGPYRGGRSAAVAGIPSEREVYYFGATGGGVWKTEDAGITWKNVSDGFFGGAIGAVAVSEWDPNVIYVGTGEKTVRGNVSHGDGMWKSTDAGRTWKHIGLSDSRHIPRVRIHPKNPDLVYAAVLGHLFGPNEERGVFRSKDGGATWQRVLFANADAGAIDLTFDPTNPRILYASTWRVRRTPYSLESGGAGSALWKSTDSGDTWAEISKNEGFPKGTLGIIGITVSPTNSDNLYAIVEAESGGVYRSRDAGKTWQSVSSDRNLRQRAWYYSRIYADPKDESVVYVLNVGFHRSEDGGRSFSRIRVPHGDNHDLWIDPNDPLRMIQSNDGGANVSDDGGATWSTQANQPTAQMYRVSTDNHFPYRLLGGQQDNSAVRIQSRNVDGGTITTREWEPTAGGESGHVVAKPDDPDVVYGGSYGGYLEKRNHRTGERRAVNPWPNNPMGAGAGDQKYRFQWNFPLFFSAHDANELYAAANVLFRTRDGGASWDVVSPDLTRNDPTRLGSSGGPITKDNTSVEYYGTIFAALESPHERGVLWAGSDDGVLSLSRDGGKNWSTVTPPMMPEWSMINSLEAHPFEKGGLYVAATRYKSDDFAPYLYRTTDYGKSWTRIDGGIDRLHFTRVVRADPKRRGLLFAGTESGLWLSFDDGGSWQRWQGNLPIVPITDLAIRGGDLIAATQGRGYWIFDDLGVVRELTPEITKAPYHLFAAAPALRVRAGRFNFGGQPGGTNPRPGAGFIYLLTEEPKGDAEVKLEILDTTGTVIRTYTRAPKADAKKEREEGSGGENLALVPAEKGLNRFVWDLSLPPAEGFKGMILWSGDLSGPAAMPGSYRARLKVGEETREVPFEVVADPRSSATREDYKAQFDFMIAVRDKLTAVHKEIGRIRDARSQIDAVTKRAGEGEVAEALKAAGKALKEKMAAVEEALYQTKNQSGQDPLNFPIRLNDKLAGVLDVAGSGDYAPTAQTRAVRAELETAIDAELAKLKEVWEKDLPAFNQLVKDKGIEAIVLKP